MKRSQSVAFVCFIAALCLLTTAVPGHSREKVIKLNYAEFYPPVHKQSILIGEWCKEVEKRTGGRVKINHHAGGTLVPAGQSYEGAVRGIADISLSASTWMPGRFPLSEVLWLPLGIRSSNQATNMTNEWVKKFKPKEYDDVKLLYYECGPTGVVQTLKPLPSIHDLKDKKIRAGGDPAKIIAAMGAVPVSVPLGDIYESLQRGVAEGLIMPAEALKGWRFADFIRGVQINDGNGYANAQMLVMNKKKWHSLPADIQKIIEEINEEWIPKHVKVWDETEEEGIAFGVSKGMKVFKIPPEEVAETKKMMKPVLDAYVKSMEEKGLPGEESLKFCLDYLEAHPN